MFQGFFFNFTFSTQQTVKIESYRKLFETVTAWKHSFPLCYNSNCPFSHDTAAGFWPIQKHARKSQGVCSKPAGCQEKMKDRRHEPERLLKFTAFLQHGTAPQSGSLRLCRLHLYFRHGWLFSQNSWDCIWWTTTCNKAEYVMCLFSEYKLCIAVIICLFNPTLKNKQTKSIKGILCKPGNSKQSRSPNKLAVSYWLN